MRYLSRWCLVLVLVYLSAALAQTADIPANTPKISISGLPSLLTLPPLNKTSPLLQISLPTTSPLYITLNICSLTSNTSLVPTVLLTTTSPPVFSLGSRRPVSDFNSGGTNRDTANKVNRDEDVWSVTWDKGFANWTWADEEPVGVGILFGLGLKVDGSVDEDVAGSGEGNVVIQLGVSSTAPRHALSPTALLQGDTTPSSVLLFSPLLLTSPHPQPIYPNYTLPTALLSLPDPTTFTSNISNLSPTANLTFIMIPTTSSPTSDGLDNSLCAVQAANVSTGDVGGFRNRLLNSTTQWVAVGGEEGFRTFWVVGDLVAETNYTAWVVDGAGGMGSPIWFATKEASFPCPLALPNSLCPSLSYTTPLQTNPSNPLLPLTTLPNTTTNLITTSLQSFSTSLLTNACGRDLYSHVSTCADCYASYRDWICRIAIPQCVSPTPPTSNTTYIIPPQTVTRTVTNPRIPSLPPAYDFTELLPCLASCNSVDRTCPVNMGFRCPKRDVNADKSYAFLGMDDAVGDGSMVDGLGAGAGLEAADRWGWRWCNG